MITQCQPAFLSIQTFQTVFQNMQPRLEILYPSNVIDPHCLKWVSYRGSGSAEVFSFRHLIVGAHIGKSWSTLSQEARERRHAQSNEWGRRNQECQFLGLETFYRKLRCWALTASVSQITLPSGVYPNPPAFRIKRGWVKQEGAKRSRGEQEDGLQGEKIKNWEDAEKDEKRQTERGKGKDRKQ